MLPRGDVGEDASNGVLWAWMGRPILPAPPRLLLPWWIALENLSGESILAV